MSAPATAWTDPRYLLGLVELELIDRERRMVERRIKAAGSEGLLSTSIADVRDRGLEAPFGSSSDGMPHSSEREN